MQRNLPLLGAIPQAKNAPDSLLRRFVSAAQCVDVSIRLRALKAAFVAEAIGMTAPTLSRIRKGRRELPKTFPVDRFCAVCGTRLLRQFLDAQAPPCKADQLAAELRAATLTWEAA